MNYYKHYLGDYARATGHLSLAEHGAYRVLLDHYYASTAPLPGAIDALNRLCRAFTELERAAVESVAEQFFPLEADGMRHNQRADLELANYARRATHNREIGKRGGRPRKNPEITRKVSKTKPGNNPEITLSQKPEARSENSNPEESTPSAARRGAAPPKNGTAKIDFDGIAFNGITEHEALHWQTECYPGVSVPDEIARAAEWLKSNPANKKKNYRRFLTNWFSRSQERARPKP